jgi:hypothetical protein
MRGIYTQQIRFKRKKYLPPYVYLLHSISAISAHVLGRLGTPSCFFGNFRIGTRVHPDHLGATQLPEQGQKGNRLRARVAGIR